MIRPNSSINTQANADTSSPRPIHETSTRPIMLDTVPRRRYARKPALRFRGHAVYLRAAADAGVTANTLAKNTPPLIERLAHVLRCAAAIPDPGFIERIMQPLDAARLSLVVPPLTPELIQKTQAIDMTEDVSESRFCTTGTIPALRQWIRDQEHARAASLVQILAAKQRLADMEAGQ